MSFDEDWSVETVGSILKKNRESKHLSLKDVAEKTFLKESFLKALEEDKFDALPAKIHINGFITLYAKYLELDANKLLLKLRKQEILNQDTPVKEIIDITRDRKIFKEKYNPMFFVTIGLIACFISFLFFGIFHKSSSKASPSVSREIKDTNALSENNPEAIFNLKKGDSFKFSIGNYSFVYQLVDFSDQSVVINYQKDDKRIYILNNEVLEHDYTGKFEYGYSINKEKLENSVVTLKVKMIKAPRAADQSALSTFLVNQTASMTPDLSKAGTSGNISFVNKGSSPIILSTLDINNVQQELVLASYGKLNINLLKEDKTLNLKTISIGNLAPLSITINGKLLDPVRIKGAIGVITLKQNTPHDIDSITYSLDY